MTMLSKIASTLPKAIITPHLSGNRGHSEHGWLNSDHSFVFASFHDGLPQNFGALRVLNGDRVAPPSGFPTHPHRDFEIFSYVVSGVLTHRDSTTSASASSSNPASQDTFSRLHRGDVQFTTGGTGTSHSEQNESSSSPVHFLQIWVSPWVRGLTPRYHTTHFHETAKRTPFVRMVTPLAAGKGAAVAEEATARPRVPDTIPIHADVVFAAGVPGVGRSFGWQVGLGAVPPASGTRSRKLYVHVVMGRTGDKVRLDERLELGEGDGAFVEGVLVGEELVVESVGVGDAEVVVLDPVRASFGAGEIDGSVMSTRFPSRRLAIAVLAGSSTQGFDVVLSHVHDETPEMKMHPSFGQIDDLLRWESSLFEARDSAPYAMPYHSMIP